MLFLILLLISVTRASLIGQAVSINNYSVSPTGQVLLEVNSSDENYYILEVKDNSDNDQQKRITSVVKSEGEFSILSEPFKGIAC